MALVTCKECRNEVDLTTNICPHCGVKRSEINLKQTMIGVVIFAVIVFATWSCSDGKDKKEAAAVAPKTGAPMGAENKNCRNDIECWGNKHIMSASTDCQPHVEKVAKYSFKWLVGPDEPKFGHFEWADQAKGHVKYVGEKVQFDTGTGTFQTFQYDCNYDTLAKKVKVIRVRPAR